VEAYKRDAMNAHEARSTHLGPTHRGHDRRGGCERPPGGEPERGALRRSTVAPEDTQRRGPHICTPHTGVDDHRSDHRPAVSAAPANEATHFFPASDLGGGRPTDDVSTRSRGNSSGASRLELVHECGYPDAGLSLCSNPRT